MPGTLAAILDAGRQSVKQKEGGKKPKKLTLMLPDTVEALITPNPKVPMAVS